MNTFCTGLLYPDFWWLPAGFGFTSRNNQLKCGCNRFTIGYVLEKMLGPCVCYMQDMALRQGQGMYTRRSELNRQKDRGKPINTFLQCVCFFHPTVLPSSHVSTGSLRRFNSPWVHVTESSVTPPSAFRFTPVSRYKAPFTLTSHHCALFCQALKHSGSAQKKVIWKKAKKDTTE